MTRGILRARRSGQTLTEYVLLCLFVVIAVMVVLVEFEDVLRLMYINAVSLVFCSFP